MLERARAEAEARRAAQIRSNEAITDTASNSDARKAEDERRIADEQRRVEEERRHTEAAQRADAERRAAEERRMVEERRRAEEQKRAEDTRLAAEAQRKADEERRIADEQRRAEEVEYARMEAERDAEAVRIDEALSRAREAWVKRQTARASEADNSTNEARAPMQAPPGPAPRPEYDTPREFAVNAPLREPPRAGGNSPDADGFRSSTRVTILMVLEPGSRGIRRHNKTADPLLCGERGCYVGAGPDTAARFLPRQRAFGPMRTLGERAGACRNSLGCVFRGVDLVAYPAVIQPIDMRILRHDRRQPHVLDETSDCRLNNGRLSCTPIQGPDYTLWIVPEPIAERAGPRELERVVEAGLRSHAAMVVRD